MRRASYAVKPTPQECPLVKPPVDLDRLATYLRSRMEAEHLSIRAAAEKIGVSPATLGRLLQGAGSPNIPDSVNLMRAVAWLGKNLSEFEAAPARGKSSLADVEVHLRALPNLGEQDAEALVAMVKAAYESAVQLRAKKKPVR